MKKLLIALASIVLLGVLVMPYVTGRVAETVTQQFAAQVNSNPLQYGKLDIQQYQRGFNSTDLRLSWSPNGAAASAIDEAVVYTCAADHGVFNFSYQCRAENLPNYTEFVAEKLNGKDPLTIIGKVSVLGNITQQIRVDAFELTDEEGERFEVLPGLLNVKTDKALSSFGVTGTFDGLKVHSDNGSLSISDIKLNGDLARNQHNLLVGDFGFSIDQLASSEAGKSKGTLNGFRLRGETLEVGDNLKVDYQLSAEQYRQGVDSEATDIADLQFAMQLAGVNMAQLTLVLEKLQSLAGQSEANGSALKLAILPELEALLQPGLSFGAELSAKSGSEALNGEFQIELVENLRLGDFLLMAVNPQSVLSKAEVAFASQLPKTIFRDNPQAQAKLASSPWFIQTKQGYQSEFALNNGEINLNGKTLTVEELLALGTR